MLTLVFALALALVLLLVFALVLVLLLLLSVLLRSLLPPCCKLASRSHSCSRPRLLSLLRLGFDGRADRRAGGRVAPQRSGRAGQRRPSGQVGGRATVFCLCKKLFFFICGSFFSPPRQKRGPILVPKLGPKLVPFLDQNGSAFSARLFTAQKGDLKLGPNWSH